MEIDPDVYLPIDAAFEDGNLDELRRLLTANPKYLRDVHEGNDWWKWKAAIDGRLPELQALVSLGLDVNESRDIPDPDNPFCIFEGPILHASTEGHADVVRWLLEKGAKINYTVNGKVRCLPLLRAACRGHLEIVKLLVEHGADLNFDFNGHTPLSQAEGYGHPEVAAYLQSVSAK